MRCPPFLPLAFFLAPALTAGAADRLFVTTGVQIDRYDLPSDTPTTIVAPTPSGASWDATGSPDGYIYLSDGVLKRIERWDEDGGSHAVVPMPAQPEGFDPPIPTGLAFDPVGDLYINTYFTDVIDGAGAWRLAGGDPGGVPERVIAPFAARGRDAETIEGGPHQGAILFAAQDRVVISEPAGAPVRDFVTASHFEHATSVLGLETNACGEVFVGYCTELKGCWVDRFDPEGAFLGNHVRGTLGVNWLELDSEGNLYVSDTGSEVLWKVTPDGSRSRFGNTKAAAIFIRLAPLPCIAGGPYRAECAGATTCIALQTEVEDRPCRTFRWTSDCPGADFGGTESSRAPTLCLATAGACSTRCGVSLTVEEGLRVSTCEAEVAVEDTTAPAFAAGSSDLRCLWPPDHRYDGFDVEELAPAAVEACNEPVTWRFTGCASNQPEDADETDPGGPWGGDGHTREDCVIVDGGGEVCVRVERAGRGPTAGDGRRYEVVMEAADACGNTSAPAVTGYIHVPHDRRPARACEGR